MLLPIATYPYLIRVLGKETYGLIVFAQAIVGYLLILVNYGFNISATKDISIHRNNEQKLSEIVSSVLTIKGFLVLVTIIIMAIMVYFIPAVHDNRLLFFFTLWICVYDFIFPVWYFQGIEKMNYITYITLISRLTFLGLIFFLIHDRKDYLLVPLINGLGALLAGLTSLYILFGKHRVKFKWPSFQMLNYYFKESSLLFISNLSIKIYVSTSKVIIGAFLGMTEVAYYDLAEKLTTLLKTPIFILGQSIFPDFSRHRNIEFVKKMMRYTIVVVTLITAVSILLSRKIIFIIGGSDMINASPVFQILASTTILITISLFFGNILLLGLGHNKDYLLLRTYAILTFLFVIGILILIHRVNLFSLASLTVFTEGITAVLSILFWKKIKSKPNKHFEKHQTKR